MRLASVFFLLCAAGWSQLIPAGQPVPKTSSSPVVFLNGYEFGCINDHSFAGTFDVADQVLQSAGLVSLFFDNCAVANNPNIEALGAAFGQFLAGLKYTDGTPVTQVDVVAHSLGGLIVRAYLAGMADVVSTAPPPIASPSFAFLPPANPGIRKFVMLGVPNFGTGVANKFGNDAQTAELEIGSQFLFNLNTWNNGTDDLRGVDVVAIAGSGGTGSESTIPGFDDGAVTLTSASVAFARPGRTRVVPYCHTSYALLVTANYCPANAPDLAYITGASHDSAQIILSFLGGTNAWQSVGTAIESDPVGSNVGGINIEAQDLNGAEQPINSATLQISTGTLSLKITNGNIAWTEGVTPNASLPASIQFLGTTKLTPNITLPASTVLPYVAKPGPVVARVFPAASAAFPLNIAQGEFVAIYGSNLANGTQQATSSTYPTQLADAQVLVNGVAVPLEYVSASQINAVFSTTNTSGLVQVTVQNSSGAAVTNVLLAPAVPEIFSLDFTGSGAAAAINGVTGAVVSAASPLHAGDYLSLFLTGLGATTTQNGLSFAQTQPAITIGSQSCRVTYAGRAPTIPGVDQINCVVPGGVSGSALPVIVTSGGRASNTVTLAVQ
jgi:uncharacterized protein (TIGR03437 family)